jgi:hypothetical protein
MIENWAGSAKSVIEDEMLNYCPPGKIDFQMEIN